MIYIKKNGILDAIFSATIFGAMPLFTKLIYGLGANPLSAAFYRMGLSLVFIFLIGKRKNNSFALNSNELKYLIIASLSFAFTSLTLFGAYNYMESGAVTSIHFAYPIIIFIMVSIKVKKMPSINEALAIVVCTVALTLLSNPTSSVNTYGAVLAFASAITYSIYSYTLDNDALKNLNRDARLFYVNLFSTFILIIFSLVTKEEIKLDLNSKGWLMAFLYSAILTLGATSLYQKAIAYIGAKDTSILSTFEPITSVIIGIIVLGEKISIIQLISIVLILTSATYLISHEEKLETE